MAASSLEDLYRLHQGKVSDKWAFYFEEYDRILAGYRNRPVRLLEIGIQNGGSMEIWGKYFPASTKLVGCDINADCERLTFDDPRISVVVADANLDSTEAAILRLSDRFDIVIDDGSHQSGDIVRVFTRYFPHLDESGVFVAEDLHCSYWQTFGGGLFNPYSAITFFKHLADIVNHEHWGVPVSRTELLRGIAARYGASFDEEMLKTIRSIEFVNSICIVRKHPGDQGLLGRRLIAGTEALVLPEILSLAGSTSISSDERHNTWSARSGPSGEELVERLEELGRKQAEINLLAATLAKTTFDVQVRDQAIARREAEITAKDRLIAENVMQSEQFRSAIDAILNSTSWRVTLPLRLLGGLCGSLTLLGKRLVNIRRTQGGVVGLLRYALRRAGRK